jgi:hypothetical protein
MGKRAILAAVLFGLLVAGLQVWLVSAMLSKPLPSGRTGWERVATAASKTPRRDPSMPYIEINAGPNNAYGCSQILPGQMATITVTPIAPSCPSGTYPPLHWALGLGSPPTSIYGSFIGSDFGKPYTMYSNPVSGDTVLYLVIFGCSSSEVLETYAFPIAVDSTSVPSFTTSTSYECNPDGIGVAEWTVSAVVDNQPSSWSYELYSGPDATGNRIYAGSVNSAPSPPECSATMSVTGIPVTVESIKLIATNANGTANTVVNLAALGPDPMGLSISAEPLGILEGQDVTLNWTVGINTESAEIDNGVGVVYVAGGATSGSVTVSPTETTTYTITARSGCAEITASVEVYVQAVPRVQSAMIRLIAQEGLASTKTAQVDESAKMRLIANDLDRRTHRKVAGHRFNIQPAEERTPHEKVAGHRFNVRAERRKVSGHRFDVRATRTKVAGHRFRILYPDRMHVYARNTATGAVLDLGAIEMDAAELVLTDVAIPDGDWQFWTERESTFWKSNRSRDSQVVRLASGAIPAVDPLPAVINLAASVSRAITTLTWDVSHPIPEWGLNFGLWFSETSPVATFVTPTALVEASKMRTSYSAIRRQSGAEYVAVALIGADGSLGTAAEIELPWVVIAPQSPPNQTTGG